MKDLFGRTGTCPRCQSPRVLWRGTARSFCIAGIVTLVLVLVNVLMARVFGPGISHGSSDSRADFLYHLALFLTGLALVGVIYSMASGVSALFGRNRCRDCGHRWR